MKKRVERLSNFKIKDKPAGKRDYDGLGVHGTIISELFLKK